MHHVSDGLILGTRTCNWCNKVAIYTWIGKLNLMVKLYFASTCKFLAIGGIFTGGI